MPDRRCDHRLHALKTLNYLKSISARRAAEAAGFDEAIFVESGSAILEGAVSNIFIVKHGVVQTPPLAQGILPGIVRAADHNVAGKLDLTMGGPSFQDFRIEQPQHSPHYKYTLHDPDDPRSHRRSIYRLIVRSQPQPFLTALDCADPALSVDKRNESIGALQALALMNNGFVMAMASHFASRLEREANGSAARIDRALQLALGRQPMRDERDDLVRYAGQHGLPNACRVIFNLNEFVFVD